MAADFPDHPFWDFSLNVYGKEGVPAACLELQDHHQIDVNIVLFCCWLAASGRGVLSKNEVTAMCESVEGWHHEIVREVRAVRGRLKGGYPPAPVGLSDPLRARLAKLEVDLEHVEQLMLTAAVDRPAQDPRATEDRLCDAIDNVKAYFLAFGAVADSADAASLSVILHAAFADLPAAAVDRECASRLVH